MGSLHGACLYDGQRNLVANMFLCNTLLNVLHVRTTVVNFDVCVCGYVCVHVHAQEN